METPDGIRVACARPAPRRQSGQAVCDTEFDGSIVAQLEMEPVVVGVAAPVAAIECVAAAQREGAGHRPGAVVGEDQHGRAGQAFLEALKEVRGQPWLAPLALEGRAVEAVESRPVCGLDLRADQGFDAQAMGGDQAPLAPDFLALARGQIGQEMFEIGVTRVEPMVLAAEARQQAGGGADRLFVFAQEQAVPGREAVVVAQRDRGRDQARGGGRGVVVVADQQAPPADRREGHRADELGIVAPARAFVGFGPAPIETKSP